MQPARWFSLLAWTHTAAQLALVAFGLHRLSMLFAWLRGRQSRSGLPSLEQDAPFVTVQLPIYNERFVAARLIDAAAALDWPRDRLEIQLLDDSDDDTSRIVDARAEHWRAEGVSIAIVRRAERSGYKAGALSAGLDSARGELLAIFDADFLPPRDFLRATVPSFTDPRVGMAQARWGYVNAEHSWLTRAQSVSLGAHFRIEHEVRYRRGLFFNFNGTAGVWRRRTVEEAGGWQSDTVTEDLDLSYRAQMAGWRFAYLDDVVVPSELPVTLAALRTQQRRWAKGSVQTGRKILPRLLRAQLPLRIKLEATLHLCANLGWLLGLVLFVTLYPAIVVHTGRGWREFLRSDLPLVLGSSGAYLLYYAAAGCIERGARGWRAALLLPVLWLGIAPVVCLGLVEGLWRRGGSFERTPKFGVRGREALPRLASLYRRTADAGLLWNVLLLGPALIPLILALGARSWAAVPFLLFVPAALVVALRQELRDRARLRSDSTS